MRRPLRHLVQRVSCAILLLVAGACGGGAETPGPFRHAVLISVDTLRADRLGAYGYAAAHTPAIDALAAQSIRFENAFAHSSSTLPSMASLLSGRLPGGHAALSNFASIAAGVPTLATWLDAAGFACGGFVGNWILRAGRGFDTGFGAYTQRFAQVEGVRGYPENAGRLVTDQAIAWLEGRDREARVFLWVHYQEPHGPYTPPEWDTARAAADGPELPRNETNSGREGIPEYQWLGHGRLAEYLARYDGEVAEMDRQVGRLLRALSAEGILDEGVVVFTADHGEAFGEGGIFLAHGENLSDVLLRVPLLLRIPGHPPAVRRDVVRLVDVAPTLLELVGVTQPDALDGESLLRETGDRPVAAQLGSAARGIGFRSLRTGDYKIVERRDVDLGRPDVVVHDLRAGRAVETAERRELVERLQETLDRVAPWSPYERGVGALTEKEREALEALGYLD